MSGNGKNKIKRCGRPVVVAGEDARSRLLDAAVWLYSEQGIAATTVAQVAQRAGVTSAMVHYYFKNREQLTDVVFMERVLLFRDLVWSSDIGKSSQMNAIEMLSLLVGRIIAATEKLPWLPNLWVKEVLNENGLLRERLMKNFSREQFKQISLAIADGQRRGKLNSIVQPALTVVSVFGLTMMLLATKKVWGALLEVSKFEPKELERHILSLLINGLLANKVSGRKL